MHQDSSITTATRTTLCVSQWHFPRTCTHCGETIPAGGPTCHYFKDAELMIVCRQCAAGPEFCSPFPPASSEPVCPTCGQPLDNGTCFNIACPDGLTNVQREVGTAPEPKIVPFRKDQPPEPSMEEIAEKACGIWCGMLQDAIEEHERRYHGKPSGGQPAALHMVRPFGRRGL